MCFGVSYNQAHKHPVRLSFMRGRTMKPIIEIKNLKKYFGKIKAVDGINFNVNEGELFAFLGQNGAGKSTTISIICGRLLKDSGEVTINGNTIENNSDSIKRDIGVVFQNSVLRITSCNNSSECSIAADIFSKNQTIQDVISTYSF